MNKLDKKVAKGLKMALSLIELLNKEYDWQMQIRVTSASFDIIPDNAVGNIHNMRQISEALNGFPNVMWYVTTEKNLDKVIALIHVF